jgi:hypothetical protein
MSAACHDTRTDVAIVATGSTAGVIVGATPSVVTAAVGPDDGDVPTAFDAVTVKVYAVAFARPVTVQDRAEAATEHVAPPGADVTVYAVIGDPPSQYGGYHDTTAEALLPAVAFTPDGATGTVGGGGGGGGGIGGLGLTGALGADGADVPSALVAVTVNVYHAPFISPDTVQDNAGAATEQVGP